jgi:Domain of unknown function (DUF4214)
VNLAAGYYDPRTNPGFLANLITTPQSGKRTGTVLVWTVDPSQSTMPSQGAMTMAMDASQDTMPSQDASPSLTAPQLMATLHPLGPRTNRGLHLAVSRLGKQGLDALAAWSSNRGPVYQSIDDAGVVSTIQTPVPCGPVLSPNQRFVSQLYQELLGRAPDAAGLADWDARLRGGATRQQAAAAFWNSAEHRGLQVDGFYATYLGRAADAPSRASWVGALLGGMSEAEVAVGFLTSEEYRLAHPSTTAYLTGLFTDVLGRDPDPDGLAAWQRAAQGGLSRAALADAFLKSGEAQLQLVDQYYADYLVRAADPAGVAAWLAALQSGRLSPAQVAQAFLASDEFYGLALLDG